MVSTRSHPSAFPPPELASPTKSPSKRGGSRASSTASPAPSAKPVATSNAGITSAPAFTSNNSSVATTTASSRAAAAPAGAWAHTPSNLTLIWLAVSLPLVVWDTGYMLLRPHTMPGGALHWPVWQPYALYGTVDHVYGFPAWEAGDGFGAAQASLNAVETALYLAYLGIVLNKGRDSGAVTGRGAPNAAKGLWLAHARTVAGRPAGQAVLIGLSAAVMTLSKTVLYWLCEWFNGFHNIGHNDFWTLLTLWIIPNGLWLVFSAIMTYQFSAEIVQGLDVAASAGSSKKLE